jgi:rhamnosyltransferase
MEYDSEMKRAMGSTANGVCAIIISYNDHVDCIKCVESIRGQVERTIVVDNGSEQPHIEALERYELGKDGLTLYRLNSNKGVGTAINSGLTWAADRGYTNMLTLDQDSIADGTMVEEMLSALAAENDHGDAILGAKARSKNDIRISNTLEMASKRPLSESDKRKAADRLISSGMLINERILRKIGLMRESYFIDSVDQEYCLRARRQGIRCVVVENAILYHDIGQVKKRRLLSFSWRRNVHKWERMYYISRNHVRLWREHGMYFPKLVLVDMFDDIKTIIDLLLFEKHRGTYLRMIFLGYLDGIIGRSGSLNE